METIKKGNQRKALGRGLSALISTPPVPIHERPAERPAVFYEAPASSSAARHLAVEAEPAPAVEGLQYVDISLIVSNPHQPRQQFSEAELKELSASITALGVLQPIVVRPMAHADKERCYEIVAGERRWRAAKMAGIDQVPVIVKELSDRESLEIAIVENVQRDDLNPMEEAQAYQRLLDEYNLTQQELSTRVGKDRASVANYLRLLKLPAEIGELVREEKLSMGHAKAILTVREPNVQRSLAKKVVDEQLSVRKLEEIVSRVVVLESARREGRARSDLPRVFPEVTDRLRQALGTKVSIQHHRSGKGRIEVSYFSEEELDRLVELLCG